MRSLEVTGLYRGEVPHNAALCGTMQPHRNRSEIQAQEATQGGPAFRLALKSFPARSAAAGHPQALSGAEEARSALTAAAYRGLSDDGDCPTLVILPARVGPRTDANENTFLCPCRQLPGVGGRYVSPPAPSSLAARGERLNQLRTSRKWIIMRLRSRVLSPGFPTRPRRREHVSRERRLRDGRVGPSRRHPLERTTRLPAHVSVGVGIDTTDPVFYTVAHGDG